MKTHVAQDTQLAQRSRRPRRPGAPSATSWARADADRDRIRSVLRPGALLQRKCGCGAGPSPAARECAQCSETPAGIQTQLQISQPGDAYEREADRVAAQVLASPAPVSTEIAAQLPRVSRLQRAPDDKKKEKSPPKPQPCDEERLKPAKEQAQRLARKALDALEREYPLSYESKAMSAHFGSITRDQKAKIIERYKHVLDTLDKKTYVCPDRAKKVRSGTSVVDLCGEASCPGNEIHLFPDFGKEICPAGPVLLHESLHNTGACDDIDRGGQAYPPSAPEDNPYSYEYFALAVSQGYKEPDLPKHTPKAPRMQRSAESSASHADPSSLSVARALSSGGQPLEPALRGDMEQRFGSDFSQVRLHVDTAAAESARDVNAKAYTLGSDIVFGASRFQPHTDEGRHLLAHELTHVLQQSGPDPDTKRP